MDNFSLVLIINLLVNLLIFLTDPSFWILKIGKRVSPNYYRVYQNQTQIRFELEQRRAIIKPAQKLIFQDHIEEFERVMTEKFFKYSKRILAIDENYTDWLIDYFRRQN